MNGKEKQSGIIENTGEYARNGGIIAGLIGFFTSWELFTAGIVLAGSGEILRRIGRSKK